MSEEERAGEMYGREGGRKDYSCFHQHQHSSGREKRCWVFRHGTGGGAGGGGGGGGSSLALYANQQDPRAQMSRDRAGGEAEACTAPVQPSERGCVSSAMMS